MLRMTRTPVWMTFGAILLLTFSAGGASASDSRPQAAADDQGVWTFVGLGDPCDPCITRSAAYDPIRHRLVVLGMTDYPPYGAGTVYFIQLGETVTHGPLETIGPPNSVAGSPAIYDPINDRMIVYSGTGPSYVLSFSTPVPTWSVLPAGELPPARSYSVAVFDPVGERMVIFGGQASPYDHLNDVWAYSFATESWSNITPSEPPEGYSAGISFHAAIYDPVRSRLVSYGGASRSTSPSWSTKSVVNGCTLGNPMWETLPNGAPSADHSLVYDSNRDRMVAFGGRNVQAGYLYGNPRAFSFTTQQWSSLSPTGSPPSDRFDHVAAYDPALDQMVIYGGGYYGAAAAREIWLLTWNQAPVAGVGPATATARLGVRAPGPIVRSTPFAVTSSFAQAGQARLDLMDVGGRVVESVSLRVDGPGERATVMGRASMQPGVYFLRLEQRGAQARAKVALIR